MCTCTRMLKNWRLYGVYITQPVSQGFQTEISDDRSGAVSMGSSSGEGDWAGQAGCLMDWDSKAWGLLNSSTDSACSRALTKPAGVWGAIISIAIHSHRNLFMVNCSAT